MILDNFDVKSLDNGLYDGQENLFGDEESFGIDFENDGLRSPFCADSPLSTQRALTQPAQYVANYEIDHNQAPGLVSQQTQSQDTKDVIEMALKGQHDVLDSLHRRKERLNQLILSHGHNFSRKQNEHDLQVAQLQEQRILFTEEQRVLNGQKNLLEKEKEKFRADVVAHMQNKAVFDLKTIQVCDERSRLRLAQEKIETDRIQFKQFQQVNQHMYTNLKMMKEICRKRKLDYSASDTEDDEPHKQRRTKSKATKATKATKLLKTYQENEMQDMQDAEEAEVVTSVQQCDAFSYTGSMSRKQIWSKYSLCDMSSQLKRSIGHFVGQYYKTLFAHRHDPAHVQWNVVQRFVFELVVKRHLLHIEKRAQDKAKSCELAKEPDCHLQKICTLLIDQAQGLPIDDTTPLLLEKLVESLMLSKE